MPKLITRKQAAELLQVTVETIDRFKRDGLIPYIRVRGTVRFVREDFEAFLQRHMVAG